MFFRMQPIPVNAELNFARDDHGNQHILDDENVQNKIRFLKESYPLTGRAIKLELSQLLKKIKQKSPVSASIGVPEYLDHYAIAARALTGPWFNLGATSFFLGKDAARDLYLGDYQNIHALRTEVHTITACLLKFSKTLSEQTQEEIFEQLVDTLADAQRGYNNHEEQPYYKGNEPILDKFGNAITTVWGVVKTHRAGDPILNADGSQQYRVIFHNDPHNPTHYSEADVSACGPGLIGSIASLVIPHLSEKEQAELIDYNHKFEEDVEQFVSEQAGKVIFSELVKTPEDLNQFLVEYDEFILAFQNPGAQVQKILDKIEKAIQQKFETDPNFERFKSRYHTYLNSKEHRFINLMPLLMAEKSSLDLIQIRNELSLKNPDQYTSSLFKNILCPFHLKMRISVN